MALCEYETSDYDGFVWDHFQDVGKKRVTGQDALLM